MVSPSLGERIPLRLCGDLIGEQRSIAFAPAIATPALYKAMQVCEVSHRIDIDIEEDFQVRQRQLDGLAQVGARVRAFRQFGALMELDERIRADSWKDGLPTTGAQKSVWIDFGQGSDGRDSIP